MGSEASYYLQVIRVPCSWRLLDTRKGMSLLSLVWPTPETQHSQSQSDRFTRLYCSSFSQSPHMVLFKIICVYMSNFLFKF